MKKRMISVLLAVNMIASLVLSGCSTEDTAVPPTEKVATSATINTTEATSATINSEAVPEVAVAVEETTLPSRESSIQNTEATEEETVPETTVPQAVISEAEPVEDEQEEDNLTTTQRNSINMLNYITVLTQEINASKGSRIYLEYVQSSLLNNIYPNAVDTKTQSQINNLWKTIDEYRMISVKRERLEYIYEQNKAQALRKAIPNPLGLLSTVQSGNMLQTAASVLYMAVDAKTSYDSAATQADLQYLQEGWELEDAETSELSASQLNLLNYMINMVRDNGFPGEFGLNEDAVKDFVKWANEDNLVRKIAWLESNEKTFQEFRTYWLELARSYYESEEYRKCLDSIEKYEAVATRIFRKDHNYAETIPMAIISAKKTMSKAKYVEFADKYVKLILDNCEEENWTLRYFAAQTYIDLYATTDNRDYLENAYQIAYDNVNILVDEQEALNIAYLADIEEEKASKDASKREKQEVKEYNKLIKDKRKTELPPVSEAFYLNCDLLFALAEELNISYSEKNDIDATVHENGQNIFLTEALDNRFWANKNVDGIDISDIDIEFNGEKLIIPASCMTTRSVVIASISGGIVLDDWKVTEVKRPKNSTDCSDFMVIMVSEEGKEYKYTAGEEITVTVIPVAETPDAAVKFNFKVIGKKTLGVFNGIEFERTAE